MAEIRGEKVKFGKGDYRPLHELPSAQVEDPIIVHTPAPRNIVRTLGRLCSVLLVLTLLSTIIVFGLIQSGSVDHVLTTQAKETIERSINPKFSAHVGSSTIRFTDTFRLALVANDVDISDRDSGQHLSRISNVSMRLDPLALLVGRLSVVRLGVDGVQLNTALLPKGNGFDLGELTIASVPERVEKLFSVLDEVLVGLSRSSTKLISIDDFQITIPTIDEDIPDHKVTVQTLQIREKPDAEGYLLAGEVDVDGRVATLDLEASVGEGKVQAAMLRLDGFDVAPFMQVKTIDGDVIDALVAKVGVIVAAKRAANDRPPEVNVTFGIGNGEIVLSGETQELTSGRVNVHYNEEEDRLDLAESSLVLKNSVLPFSGTVSDGDSGPQFSLFVKGGRVSSSLGNEPPVSFDLRANGSFDKVEKTLSIPELFVNGPMGDLAGSLKVVFGGSTPEISFGGQVPKMQATAVKQLWPFWLAKKARYWTHNNLFGGTVTNGSIAVFIPKGRLCGYGCPVNLNEQELDIKFDIADTRINVTGEIPPLRDVNAKFHMQGGKLNVDVPVATAFFPSDRKLALRDSQFSVPSFYVKPLLADVSLKVEGTADAVGELATLKPIHALQKTQFKPEDFTGNVKADVTLKVGIAAENNPQPVWDAKLQLTDFSLKPQIAGRSVKEINGEMRIDGQALHLKGKGRVDDLPAEISYIEPLDPKSDVKKQIGLTTTLSGKQINKLAPGLSSLIGGSTKLVLDVDHQMNQQIKIDLKNSTLKLPGIGWHKGAGIPASATFNVRENAGRIEVSDFSLKGDGFGADGKLALNKGQLVSASFSRMQLAPSDSFSVDVKSSNNLLEVNARGKAIDMRSLLGRLRDGSTTDGTGEDASNLSLDINLDFDKAIGFHEEVMSNLNGIVSVRGGKLRRLDLNGVSGRGQAVVAQTTRNGNVSTISLTSSDAGSLARFGNLYSRINSGLLNLKLSTTNGDSWSGSIDLRNFAVMNESKLQDFVATPTGADGRSLNKAVKRNINVSSERFQRAFSRLVYVNGAVALENGIIRGEQIGATFQGLLRDRNGNMDMTGTFMPAYGLNRIFGELPIIGAILGNGTDRGLLGITFKMTGKMASPNLVINPLSLIAPGIFRQIFEFQ